MRAVLTLLAIVALLPQLGGCHSYVRVEEGTCAILAGELRPGQLLELRGDLYLDQHGDMIRPDGCGEPGRRTYGLADAKGAAAEALRKDVDQTLALFDVHWSIDATLKVERDEAGVILRIVSVRSFTRVDERPNSSFKPKPLRDSA